MTPHADLPVDLVDRYLLGTCGPADIAHINEIKDADLEQWQALTLLRERLLRSDDNQESPAVADARERLARRVAVDNNVARRPSIVGPTKHLGFFGAALAVLMVLGTLFYGTTPAPIAVQHYETKPGQRSTIRLADGSSVMLAPATSVRFTPSNIEVSGEAYFTVAPHSARPFVVRTSNAAVQVLGTRFSVRHYPDEMSSRVVVEDGRVTLQALRSRGTGDSRIISAQMLAFVTDSGISVSPGIATRDYTGWTHGMLIFKGVPLRDVVEELNRTYRANIRLRDSALASRTIVAEIELDQTPLIQILDILCSMMNAHYEQDGRSFVLSQGGSKRRIPIGQMQRNRFPQPEKSYGR
jgi:ferric-dicitrate binding protein FerR (iron transport regulator)